MGVIAKQQSEASITNETRAYAALSDTALKQGKPVDAVQLALVAWPRKGDENRPQMKRVIAALNSALSEEHERVRFAEHSNPVRSAFFSPDGTRIVTASDDKTARIWDARTGVDLNTLRHEQSVEFAAFSPDGTLIVTASDDGGARIWDATTGKEQLFPLRMGITAPSTLLSLVRMGRALLPPIRIRKFAFGMPVPAGSFASGPRTGRLSTLPPIASTERTLSPPPKTGKLASGTPRRLGSLAS
jgi:hypothetical protein